LLEKGDFGATSYVKTLQGIEGLEELALMVDDYDFAGALRIIESQDDEQ